MKTELSRRRLLQSVASLMLSESRADVFARLTSTSAQMLTDDLAKALPTAHLLISPNVLTPINRSADLTAGRLKKSYIDVDELFQDGFQERSLSQTLQLAWQANIRTAKWRIDAARHLETIIDSSVFLPPDIMFKILSDARNRETLANFLATSDIVSRSNPSAKAARDVSNMDKAIVSHFDAHLTAVAKLPDRYPALRHATSFQPLVEQLRRDAAEALELPLENGCLDRLDPRNELKTLENLLRDSPKIFPKGKYSVFKRLAADLRRNGHQTIRLEWHLHADNLPYNLGLSPYQDVQSCAAASDHRLTVRQWRDLPLPNRARPMSVRL